MTDSDQATAPGLSVFFPAYNDSGTIASLVITAVQSASKLTPNYEVIVVDDGSSDSTAQILSELARVYPQLKIVTHPVNRGYGGALRTGFASASKDVIFYTDGDAQYDPSEMELLWPMMTAGVDLVNGYKISRSDPLHRIVIGRIYHHTVKILFGLRVRDVDCDFRLLRRSIFDRVRLEKNSGVICLEMMKKIQDAGFRIVEVPVHHYHRAHGQSQFFNFRRVIRTGIDVLKLWYALVVQRTHERSPAAAEDRALTAQRRTTRAVTLPHQDFYRGRRVMITGGLGFIGSNIARRLVEFGADVLLMDSLIPGLRREFLQHRRHRRQSARQHRGRAPGKHDEPPGPRSRGHLQPRRAGEPHRQHEGSRIPISRSTAAASCRFSRRAASSTRA